MVTLSQLEPIYYLELIHTLFSLDLQPCKKIFIKLTLPRIILIRVQKDIKEKRIKERKTSEHKIIYWFIQPWSLGHFVVLSSFSSFIGATPVVVVVFFFQIFKY